MCGNDIYGDIFFSSTVVPDLHSLQQEDGEASGLCIH